MESYETSNGENILGVNTSSNSWIIFLVVIIIIVIIIIIIIAVASNGSKSSGGSGFRRPRIQKSNITTGTDTLESGGDIVYFATPADASGGVAALKLLIPASPLNIAGTTIEIRNMSISPNGFIGLQPGTGVTIEPVTMTGTELGVGPFPAPVGILFATELNRFVRMQ